MKTIFNVFLTLTIISVVVSCGNHPSTDTQKQLGVAGADVHTVENGENTVSLNNGKRWKANMATTIGINNMLELMQNFSDKDNIVAYATLKVKLDNEVNSILTNCTMVGESHEQLHNYLLPLMELLRETGASDIDTCKYGFMKLEKHLKDYSNYFE